MIKDAQTDFPIHELIARRWSPYAFSERPVEPAALCSLFEAARWAPSSYNEQPWRFILATRDNPAEFARLLSCLVVGNQAWAAHAPVLALGLAHRQLAKTGTTNRAHAHDLGQAVATLTLEATSRGLYVHQMVGILPEHAREIFKVPEDVEVVTGMAIGYLADPSTLDERLRTRDTSPRSRRPLEQTVFSGEYGRAADLLGSCEAPCSGRN